jgi:hypothetical protein
MTIIEDDDKEYDDIEDEKLVHVFNSSCVRVQGTD